MATCPANYFSWLDDAEVIDIYDVAEHDLSGRDVIVGGGGLLHPPFEPFLQYILDSDTRHLVMWGVGRNAHNIDDVLIRPKAARELIDKADLVGLRDSVLDDEWVPCPSVHHPVFKQYWGNGHVQPEVEIVVLLHAQSELEVWHKPYKNLHLRMDKDIDTTLQFILKGATVVSSSYHGCLWAKWLQREVIVANSFSQKFKWGLGSTFEDAFTRSDLFASRVKALLYESQ